MRTATKAFATALLVAASKVKGADSAVNTNLGAPSVGQERVETVAATLLVEEKFGEQNFRVLTLALGAVALAKSIL